MIVLGALTLTHCAHHPVSGDRDAGQVSEQQELEMGAQANQAVLRKYAALNNPVLQAYVNEVGQRLAKQSQRPNLPWHFTVVDSPDVNAFSLPGGYVYVTRGLLTYLNSEAELAAVFGHEIGHVNARHALRWQNASTATPATGAALDSILMPPSRELLMIYAGIVDRKDPSHFTIRYTAGKTSGIIDGWLDPLSSLILKVRSGPATRPAR